MHYEILFVYAALASIAYAVPVEEIVAKIDEITQELSMAKTGLDAILTTADAAAVITVSQSG
jgi:hypothetical protein